jgi:hypothetical protein
MEKNYYCLDCGEYRLEDYDGLRKCGCNREKTAAVPEKGPETDLLDILIAANDNVTDLLNTWRHLEGCDSHDEDEKRWLTEDLWDQLINLQNYLSKAIQER